MSGIGNVHAAAVAGSEAAKQSNETRRLRVAPKPSKKKGESEKPSLKETPSSELVLMIRSALAAHQPVRPELIQAVQERLKNGHYEDRKILEKVADKLMMLFRADSKH